MGDELDYGSMYTEVYDQILGSLRATAIGEAPADLALSGTKLSQSTVAIPQPS